ncbi:nitrogenase FeMo-cofactor synthesis molybdenum delivery protein NifQ [Vibrio astriarenae]|nr:nitrogenase FeMo-cofactor synthesis molybdenum delivery protein NifQ [Vibrio sp. C7]
MKNEAEYRIWLELISRFIGGFSRLPNNLGLELNVLNTIRRDLSITTLEDGQSPNNELLPETWHEDLENSHHNSVYDAIWNVRYEEEHDMKSLLDAHINHELEYGEAMSSLIAKASLMPSHLWQILGLESRSRLGDLIQLYFPTLHEQNTLNMRWKRFFYKQLCEQEGDYVCRAPNCLHCSSFKECFVS